MSLSSTHRRSSGELCGWIFFFYFSMKKCVLSKHHPDWLLYCLPCCGMTLQAVDAVGEILLSLSYLPTAERLTVVVAKCKNLVWTNGKTTAGQRQSFLCCSLCFICKCVSTRDTWVSKCLFVFSCVEYLHIFQNHSNPPKRSIFLIQKGRWELNDFKYPFMCHTRIPTLLILYRPVLLIDESLTGNFFYALQICARVCMYVCTCVIWALGA